MVHCVEHHCLLGGRFQHPKPFNVSILPAKEVGAGSYQPRGTISKHRNPKKHVANIGREN